jgi:cellulose synthase (UDP-forming)
VCLSLHIAFWIKDVRLYNFWNLLIFGTELFYIIPQVIFVWLIYLKAKKKKEPRQQFKGAVDVFIPTYDEPLWLLERILKSVKSYKYLSKVFLLDDGKKEERKILCDKLGIEYIARENNNGYKAGNINHALKYFRAEFIAVFDSDHISNPDFLNYAMPYFKDEKIGAVQVILDHYNENESFVSTGAVELNDSFFSATMLGMDGWNGSVIFGSNSVFRRKALESIGGYKIGLAEDLRTSLYLHAEGWQTAYIPRILAKGIVPSDLTSYFKQQFKWARGVFNALFNDYPKLFFKLKLNHHICYSTRMTYYLTGFVVLGVLIATLYSLFSESFASEFSEYLVYSFPLVATFFASHILAGNSFRIKEKNGNFSIKGILLALGTYPVYCSAFLLEVFKLKWSFIPTPKEKNRDSLFIIFPQIIFSLAIVLGIIYRFIFSFILLAIHSGIFYAFIENRFLLNKEKFDVKQESLRYLKEFQIVL